jgi:hypothetical protein
MEEVELLRASGDAAAGQVKRPEGAMRVARGADTLHKAIMVECERARVLDHPARLLD